jgi:hypothetical protein
VTKAVIKKALSMAPVYWLRGHLASVVIGA